MSGMMFLFMAIMMVPVFLMLMFTPYITRKTESFGVSIPESNYHDAPFKKMRKSYARQTGILSVIALLIFVILGSMYGDKEETIAMIFGIILVAYIIGSFLIYLTFHREMKQIKRTASWAEEKNEHVVIDTTFRNEKNTYSNGWFLISVILIGATTFITFFQYDQIPNKIPMQYNFSGEVTSWATKSMKSVLLMPGMQIFLLALFVFINMMIGRVKQQISAENPEKSAKQNQVFRRRWSLFLIVTGTLSVVLFSVIQLSYIYPIDNNIIAFLSILVSVVTVIVAIILVFTTGQGGSRVKVVNGKNDNKMDRDDDRYWKLGQFYFNRNDPAIFLEKRFGVGWTVNLGHPAAWLFVIGILVVSIGLPLLLST